MSNGHILVNGVMRAVALDDNQVDGTPDENVWPVEAMFLSVGDEITIGTGKHTIFDRSDASGEVTLKMTTPRGMTTMTFQRLTRVLTYFDKERVVQVIGVLRSAELDPHFDLRMGHYGQLARAIIRHEDSRVTPPEEKAAVVNSNQWVALFINAMEAAITPGAREQFDDVTFTAIAEALVTLYATSRTPDEFKIREVMRSVVFPEGEPKPSAEIDPVVFDLMTRAVMELKSRAVVEF